MSPGAVVERDDAHDHRDRLSQVDDVAGHEREQEWCAGDRPVHGGEMGALDALLLGEHGARGASALLADPSLPVHCWLAEARGVPQRDAFREVPGVAIGDARKVAPLRPPGALGSVRFDGFGRWPGPA
jgi:hypothetical protein